MAKMMRQGKHYYARGAGGGAPQVLSEAVLWLDAADCNAASTTVPNRGTGGAALNAQYGSIAGADTNDPIWLASASQMGGAYFHNPPAAVNLMSMPDDGTTFTGDLSIACKYDATDRTTVGTLLVNKRQNGVDTNFFPFNFTQSASAGSLGFNWYDSAGVSHTLQAAVLVPAPTTWVGVQHDIDNGAGGNTATFYTSTDGTNWTLLQAVTEAFVGTTRRANTAVINVAGCVALSVGSTGNYYEVKIWNSLTFSGTPQRHIRTSTDFISESATTFTCTSGQTVTLSRSTAGRKGVVIGPTGRARWLLGVDDYLTIPDNALLNFAVGESLTAALIGRQWASATSVAYMTKAGAGSPVLGWVIGRGNSLVGDGVAVPLTGGANITAGVLSLVTCVRDVVADQVQRIASGVAGTPATDTTTLSLSNTSPLLIGRDMAAAYQEFELAAAMLWRRTLTTNERVAVADYYGAA